MALLYGLAVLIALWWLAKLVAGANPALLVAAVKKIGGLAALGLAGVLMFRGRLDMALFVGGFGAWLLGWAYQHPLARWTRGWGEAGASGTSTGQRSTVRAKTVEMTLDHDSGLMNGTVIRGQFQGRALDTLSHIELDAVLHQARVDDPEGVRLLEAYLDRRFAGGREHADPDADPRSRPRQQSGAMSEQEAYDILGLQPGADEQAIREAHRGLIKRLHPDAGGPSALAARVNEAKDVLLKR